MMSDSVISLRVPEETKNRLDALADSTKRSRSYLATAALNEYVDRETWQMKAIDEALKQADLGVFVSHEAVSNWLASWGNEGELGQPKPDIGV